MAPPAIRVSDAAVAAGAQVGHERRHAAPWWLDVPAIGGWALGFALVVILGISGGGYDAVLRGEAGIAAWWIAGAGVAVGALSLPRSRLAIAGLALFAGIALWTVAALTWTDSTERTVVEIGRTLGYAGILVLALAVCARTPARHLVAGLATGLAAVCGYAVLSRLQPEWFGTVVLDEVFPSARRRLAQPLGYWNALAGLAAMTLPLLLSFAGDARRPVVRAAAAALVPVAMLTVFLTVSRGGVIAAGLAVLAWFALAPNRLPKLAVLAVVGGGSAIASVAAERRDALQTGIDSALARQQGDELLVVMLLVMGGVAAATYAIALVDRHATRPAFTTVPRRYAGLVTLASVLAAVAVFVVAGGPGWSQDRFEEFQGTGFATAQNFDNSFSRLQSVDSNGRYQYWVVAREAQRDKPLTGVGPGTFEYLWARDGKQNPAGFVRDAHSLWAESLGEMGWVGFALVVGFFLLALVGGATRALRSADDEHRAALAAATAGLVGFCAIASVEWAWEMTVLGATGLVLAAACLAGRPDPRLRVGRSASDPRPAGTVQRVVTALVALLVIGVIAVPTATTADVRHSQSAVRSGDLSTAFADASAAARAQPYSATAALQVALVLERAGELGRARAAAVRATREEPVNWRAWFIRARLEARDGAPTAALASYRRARSLNPRSATFIR